MDVAGEQQIDVVSNMVKTRYSFDGTRIGVELDDEHVRQQFGDTCGPCFPNVNAIPLLLDGIPSCRISPPRIQVLIPSPKISCPSLNPATGKRDHGGLKGVL
jgi:hypothetical protein